MTPKQEKSLRVALVQATPISWMPVGMGMIAAVLEEENCEIFPVVNNFKNYRELDELAKEILDVEPDIVGLSFMTYGVRENYYLANLLRKENGNIILISGGAHPTYLPEESIENGFDFAVMGEGEESSVELVKHIRQPDIYPVNEITGIGYRSENEGIVKGESRSVNKELDLLPYPARHIFNKDDFLQSDGELKGYGAIFSTRGCPFRCTFCAYGSFGKKFRKRSVMNTVDEIEQVQKEYDVHTFNFLDDTFFIDHPRGVQICEEIINRGLNIKWNCGCRVGDVNEETLKIQKKSGCFMMNFGIESGDPDTLIRLKKLITVDQTIEAVKMTTQAGIKVYSNMMMGFPWETTENINNSLNLVDQIGPYSYQISMGGALVPIPNTEIYDEYKSEYNFENYWLKDEYQNVGQGIWKNVNNPYKVSTWFERNMYDDTVIRDEIFFNYTRREKKALYKLMRRIGYYNVTNQYGRSWRTIFYLAVGYGSFYLHGIFPSLEKFVVPLFKKDAIKIHGSYGVGYKKRKGSDETYNCFHETNYVDH